MADEERDRSAHVRPGESFHEYAARRVREASARRGDETDRIGRDAQRRATAYGRARGRL